jgi:photosystem II stability/assembly factor-like uncharacterized protein
MTNHRDPIEDWLGTDVELLPPPSGAYQRIRRSANRRKATRAVMTAAAAAVVIAAGVTLPQLALRPGGSPARLISPSTERHSPTPGRTKPSPHRSVSPSVSRPAALSGPALAAPGAPRPAAGFSPTSVTFVGASVGAALGQAPCGSRWCTSLASTTSYGGLWYRMGAPPAGPPKGGSGVSQVRFLDTTNGWAFGPELWATHDGGAHWTRVDLARGRVIDLAAVKTRVFAVVGIGCTGAGADYAANCMSVALLSSPSSFDKWRVVPGGGSGPETAGGLQIDGTNGFLLEGRTLFAGPVTGGQWHRAGSGSPTEPACLRDARSLPGPALIAPSGASVYLACDAKQTAAGPARPGQLTLYLSGDAGRTWRAQGPIRAQGTAASLAIAPTSGTLILATSRGIYYSADGRTWRTSATTGGPRGGFSFVGMTTMLRGVAVPADSRLHELFITTDGGVTWRPSVI